jgi:hypothetical protein
MLRGYNWHRGDWIMVIFGLAVVPLLAGLWQKEIL